MSNSNLFSSLCSILLSYLTFPSLTFSGFKGSNWCCYIHSVPVSPLKWISYTLQHKFSTLTPAYYEFTAHVLAYNTMHTFCLASHANVNYDVIFRACNVRYIFITSLLPSAIDDKVYYTRMALWTIRYRTINVIIHGVSLHCIALPPLSVHSTEIYRTVGTCSQTGWNSLYRVQHYTGCAL